MRDIYTVDGQASSGKSHQAIKHSIQLAKLGFKVAFVLPSKHVINELFEKTVEAWNDERVRRIDSDTEPKRVYKEIMDHLKASKEGEGEILFITHNAFLELPYWDRRKNWHVIFDEIKNIMEDLNKRLPDTFDTITDRIETRSHNVAYSIAEASEEGAEFLKKLAKNTRKDDGYAVYETLAKRIMSPNYDVYFNNANLERIKHKRTDTHDLCAWSIMKTSVFDDFASVTIMGAMFQESLLHILWKQAGVAFKPHKMQKLLRTNTIGAGRQVVIEYMFDKDWSISFRDRVIKHNGKYTTPFELIKKEVAATMKGKEYLVIANNDKDEKSDLPAGAIKAPVICHGLNTFSHINNVVYLCALNSTPATFAFAQSHDLTPDDMRRQSYLQTLYQGIMRSSLRKPESKEDVHIIVCDRQAADYVKLQIPNAIIRRNENMPKIGPAKSNKVWRDDTARSKARYKKNQLIKELQEMNVTVPKMTLIPSFYSTELLATDVSSNRVFMDDLRKMTSDIVEDKNANVLVCPATFGKKSKDGTTRGLENITSISGIWLDNDTGKLTPEQFREIFPTLWFAAFNTHTHEKYNEAGELVEKRYRIFIPTSQAMSIEVDAKIKQIIEQQLIDNGWAIKKASNNNNLAKNCTLELIEIQRAKKAASNARVLQQSGFDQSKLTPSSLFYLPCRRADDANWFFNEYEGEELDPVKWINNSTIAGMFDEKPEYVAPVKKEVVKTGNNKLDTIREQLSKQDNSTKIEEAKQKYAQVPVGIDMRNNEFFKLGLALKRYSCSEVENSQHLHAVAQDKERHDQVKSVIKSLRSPKYNS